MSGGKDERLERLVLAAEEWVFRGGGGQEVSTL